MLYAGVDTACAKVLADAVTFRTGRGVSAISVEEREEILTIHGYNLSLVDFTKNMRHHWWRHKMSVKRLVLRVGMKASVSGRRLAGGRRSILAQPSQVSLASYQMHHFDPMCTVFLQPLKIGLTLLM